MTLVTRPRRAPRPRRMRARYFTNAGVLAADPRHRALAVAQDDERAVNRARTPVHAAPCAVVAAGAETIASPSATARAFARLLLTLASASDCESPDVVVRHDCWSEHEILGWGSVRARAYGRVTRDGGFLGERSRAGRFGRCAASAGFSLGRPCDLLGLCLEHVSVVVVCPRVLRFREQWEVIGVGDGAGAGGVQVDRPGGLRYRRFESSSVASTCPHFGARIGARPA
jgi:hypothetical protein